MKHISLQLFLLLFCIALTACNSFQENTSQSEPETKAQVETEIPQSQIDEAMERSRGIEIGNGVVSAIDSFYEETGAYPQSLEDLVPDYLNEIPKTVTNLDYKYFLIEPSEQTKEDPYRLSFIVKTAINQKCAYFKLLGSNKDVWECGPATTH